MTNDEKYKTFLKAYSLINKDLAAYRKYLKDKRLPKSEKDLLSGLLCLVKDKPKEALDVFNQVSHLSDFMDGYKAYFEGLAWGMLGNSQKSAKQHVKAIKFFETEKNCFHISRPIAAVSKIYFHLRDGKRLKKYYQVFLNLMDEMVTDYQIISLEYQIFIAFIDQDSHRGLKLLDQLLENYQVELEKKMSPYHIYRIMFYVQIGDYDKAYSAFEDYKNTNGFKIKYNYFFITSMLNYITKSAPIYVYREKFQGPNFYYNQLKLIQSIINEDKSKALATWAKLQAELPELYKDDFRYVGPKDLFSVAFEKAKSNSTLSSQKVDSKSVIDFEQLKEMKTALDKLVYLLENTTDYLSKDELIKYIWNEEWTPKNDGRIRALLTRVKQKRGLDVSSVDGKYKKAS